MARQLRDGDDDLYLAALAYGMGTSLAEMAGEDDEEEEEMDEECDDEDTDEDEAARFIKQQEAA